MLRYVQGSIAVDINLAISEKNNRAIIESIDTTEVLKSLAFLRLGRDKFKPGLTVVLDNKSYGKLTKITYTVKDDNWLICLPHMYSLGIDSHR
jgi:hypothetical protein